MLRIAAFASLNGVSPKMLRAWDALGLFRPAWVDPTTGYRAYSPAQVPELRRILALRAIGVPLTEIVAMIDGGADLRAVLARRRQDLERERRDIDRRLRALDITVAMDRPGAAAGLDVVVRPLGREPVATLRVGPPHDGENAAFYALEAVVRDLGRRASRPPITIVQPRRPDGSITTEVAVPVTGRPRRSVAAGSITWTELPAVTAATTIHRGPYDGLEDTRVAIERWVVAAGLRPSGRLRYVYLQFGAEPELRVPDAFLVGRTVDFITELQVELH